MSRSYAGSRSASSPSNWKTPKNITIAPFKRGLHPIGARPDLAQRAGGEQNRAVLSGTLLGREGPSTTLRDAIGHLLNGQGGLLLVAGEAGIGKSALVATTVEEARRRGVRVLSGACWEGEGTPGYWPWVQVARGIERAAPEKWPEARAAAGEGLARLLGELTGEVRLKGGDESGFQVYDAVTRLVIGTAQDCPTIIVLEDLHWADSDSVKLLDFLVRHTALEAVLVIGTYRDTDIALDVQSVRPLLLDLEPKATTILLAGLWIAFRSRHSWPE